MDIEQIKRDVELFIDQEWESIVADIAALVKIRSVEDLAHATEDMPYGPAPFEALKTAVNIASRLGLDTHNCNGHIAYADLQGKSDKQIALIGHTDIVPEGSGWTFDPFELTRKDGYLIGRGVLDDKGPFVLSLYVAKFFKQWCQKTKERLPYTLRCLIGNNEETNMADVAWYLDHFEQPAFLFTPDADFPLICGEKGCYAATLTTDKAISDEIVYLCGGSVGNAVAGEAYALLSAKASSKFSVWPQQERISIETQNDGCIKISAQGKGAHASLPQGSINAILILVDYLLACGIGSAAERDFLALEHQLLSTTDGSSFGIQSKDDVFGELTCIGGVLRTTDGHFSQSLDCRYPTSTNKDFITKTLNDLCRSHFCSLRLDHNMDPFYISPDHEAIRVCVDTYNEFCGRDAKAYVIGGGTYARHFKCACAFGPCDPSFPVADWAGSEHSADEAYPEKYFKRALAIYIVSVARLMQLEL